MQVVEVCRYQQVVEIESEFEFISQMSQIMFMKSHDLDYTNSKHYACMTIFTYIKVAMLY